MLKKTIAYTDYNGVDREETFYFNLSKAEILEMEVGTIGGFEQMIQNIIDAQDGARLIELFKNIVLKSYGVKSPDGKRFIKNQEVRESFSQTEAFSNLFMELATDAEAAAEFVNGIMPANLAEASADADKPVLAPIA